MDVTTIGIIGCGVISDAYLKGAARSALIAVKAVADLSTEAAAAKAATYGVEAMSIGLVVGGTIVIPHLRRAVEFLDDLEAGTP